MTEFEDSYFQDTSCGILSWSRFHGNEYFNILHILGGIVKYLQFRAIAEVVALFLLHDWYSLLLQQSSPILLHQNLL